MGQASLYCTSALHEAKQLSYENSETLGRTQPFPYVDDVYYFLSPLGEPLNAAEVSSLELWGSVLPALMLPLISLCGFLKLL